MNKRWRLFIILVLVAVSGTFLYPTINWYFLIPESQKALAGSSQEEVRRYAQSTAVEAMDELKEAANNNSGDSEIMEKYSFLIKTAKANYSILNKEQPDIWTIERVLSSFTTEKEALAVLEDYYRQKVLDLKEMRDRTLQLGLDLSGGMSVTISPDMNSLAERLGEEPSAEDKAEAVDRAIEILTNRIDRFGVTEPQIRRQDNENILIEIPGDADPSRVNSFLMGKGSLAFHIVDEEATQKLMEYQRTSGLTDPVILSERVDFVPAGSVVRGYYTKDSYGTDQLERSIIIYEEVGLDGSNLTGAQVARDPFDNKPVINFTMNSDGTEIFYKLTDANVGKSLAIVMDGKVKAYARISEAIRGGVRITGFSIDEANNIALILRTAALPVDLIVEDSRAIGASLGADAVEAGILAISLGFALVILFMLVYYKGSGLIANLALILNLFFIISILSVFNLTLTLTSIAGVILTVGMAVDANVIIFERIKEEYRLGKSPSSAVKAGFQKAFWTVMDANITTFIAAIFLSQLGTGPIQGFAVTLAVGIVSSMFTALFVSRLVFDFGVQVVKIKKLSIGWGR